MMLFMLTASIIGFTFAEKNYIFDDFQKTRAISKQDFGGICFPEYDFFNNFCYKIVRKIQTAELAEAECGQDGGKLASIHSKEEAEYLISRLIPLEGCWIGLKKDSKDFLWSWTDGTEMDYRQWSENPTDETNPANYARIEKEGDWNYAKPDAKLSFFCKQPSYHHKRKNFMF